MNSTPIRHHIKRIEQTYSLELQEAERLIRTLLKSVSIDDLFTHNQELKNYRFDPFSSFVENEKIRYLLAADIITRSCKAGTVCDIGTYIPYLPIVLASLGYEVTIIDRYSLYGPRFEDAIRQVAELKGIRVVNLDILTDDFSLLGKQDVVLLMAVIEHLNGTPRPLLEKIRFSLLHPKSCLILEVPNIAQFDKRLQMFLLGRSPLPKYEYYFHSDYPFMGHNREMTVPELRYLIQQMGLSTEELYCYDYRPGGFPRNLRGHISNIAKHLLPLRNVGASIIAKAVLDL